MPFTVLGSPVLPGVQRS